MKKKRLGKSPIVVSEVCMGTMTFGSSCDEKTSFEILDHAYEAGIDFYDTAEVYPVPPKTEWVHRTEEIVGKWMKTKNRESILLATKVVGPGHGWFVPPVRAGKSALDRHNIRRAIEGSLKRLQTDYIDLYQTHWPDPEGGYEEILICLDELVDEGKIRVFGSSNETAWGVMKAQSTAEQLGTRRYETVQNNYSFLNRRFEDSLADICRREGISLLPYSPLAGGVLSGKYNGGAMPENARFTNYLKVGENRQQSMARRFVNEKTLTTVDRLGPIAASLGISTVTLSMAWCLRQDFIASTIVGANSVAQLKESLAAVDFSLSSEVFEQMEAISADILYPMG